MDLELRRLSPRLLLLLGTIRRPVERVGSIANLGAGNDRWQESRRRTFLFVPQSRNNSQITAYSSYEDKVIRSTSTEKASERYVHAHTHTYIHTHTNTPTHTLTHSHTAVGSNICSQSRPTRPDLYSFF